MNWQKKTVLQTLGVVYLVDVFDDKKKSGFSFVRFVHRVKIC